MMPQSQLASGEAAGWLGDWHPLAEQLGSADGLVALRSLSASLRTPPILDRAGLHAFLRAYHERILRPVELPAIQTAHAHVARHELRELIVFDQQLAGETALQEFAAASRRIGQYQLQKLRPLRDERIVQRYLHAVEAGEANAWHTLVYGLTLAVYSLPLRQGLAGYACHMTRGFIHAAARPLRLSERDSRTLVEDLCGDLRDCASAPAATVVMA